MRVGARIIHRLRAGAVTVVAGMAVTVVVVLSPLAPHAGADAGAEGSAARPVVRVAVWPIAPFIEEEGDGRFSGFSIDLLKDVADEAGFEIRYVQVDSVGEQLAAVRDGRADIAISAISITAPREEYVDFSVSMFESGIQAMVSDSSDAPSLGWLLRQVFSPILLAVLALMALGTVVTGVFVWAWERRHGNDGFVNPGAHGVFDGIWWATVTLFTIGYGDKVPHKVVSRLVTMMWMFAGVLMVAIITAEVTSTVTVNRLESRVESVADLAGKDVITYPGTTSWDFLIDNGIDPEPVESLDVAYEKVRARQVDAFVFDASIVEWLVANRSGVRAAGPVIKPENYGIVTAEGSDLTETVNRALLRLREDGSYDRLKRAYFGVG
ncbi:MAG: transporter substrate-binding domain-containing protein [Actinomycetota bacterium]